MLDYLRIDKMLPTLNDDFEKKMFLIEMNYWGIEIEKNVSDL